MIEIYLFGQLIEKVEKKVHDANRIMLFEFVDGEKVHECLYRLGLKLTDIGDCYINRTLAKSDDELHDLDCLELNPIEPVKYS